MPYQPPCPTTASRFLSRLLPLASGRAAAGSWALSLAMAVLTVAFQLGMPDGASVIFLYLLLAVHSVWFLGGSAGLALTAAAVVTGGIGDALIDPAGGIGFEAWNATSRLLSISLIAFLLTGLRDALALERWRSSTDHLTGALNRSAFEERLDVSLRAATQAGEALVLAYLDLDGFKDVNDRHGHAAGNRVLRAFSAAAESAIRTEDMFARLGGDEFAALLRVPSAIEGDRVAELLHHRLSGVLAGTGFAVTCSMGALVMEARQMRREEAVLDQADLLMYHAKQSGKNALHIGRGERVEGALRLRFGGEPAPRMDPEIAAWIDRAAERRGG